MSSLKDPVIYQLKVVLAGISPMIWRRLQVRSDTTLAELHYILQIVFGWSDYGLERGYVWQLANINRSTCKHNFFQPGLIATIIFSEPGLTANEPELNANEPANINLNQD